MIGDSTNYSVLASGDAGYDFFDGSGFVFDESNKPSLDTKAYIQSVLKKHDNVGATRQVGPLKTP